MAYTTNTYFSQSWRLEVLGEDPLLVYRHSPSSCILICGERYHLFLSSSYKGTNLIPEGTTLMSKSPPKAPPPNTITLGTRASTYDHCGDTNIQSIACLHLGLSDVFSWLDWDNASLGGKLKVTDVSFSACHVHPDDLAKVLSARLSTVNLLFFPFVIIKYFETM